MGRLVVAGSPVVAILVDAPDADLSAFTVSRVIVFDMKLGVSISTSRQTCLRIVLDTRSLSLVALRFQEQGKLEEEKRQNVVDEVEDMTLHHDQFTPYYYTKSALLVHEFTDGETSQTLPNKHIDPPLTTLRSPTRRSPSMHYPRSPACSGGRRTEEQ